MNNTKSSYHIREKCLGILEAMDSYPGQKFENLWEIYDALFTGWGDDLSMRVCVQVAKREYMRPSPAKLAEIAARMESPIPTADEALLEVTTLANRFGANATPHPERPTILLPGPPTFSHPIVAQCVAFIGGWGKICDGGAQYQEGGMEGAFRAIYERTETQWLRRVADCLETGTRPVELFPAQKPFVRLRKVQSLKSIQVSTGHPNGNGAIAWGKPTEIIQIGESR